jgi:hypothetical protein
MPPPKRSQSGISEHESPNNQQSSQNPKHGFQSKYDVSTENDILLRPSLPLPQPSVFHSSQDQNHFAPAHDSIQESENVTNSGGDLQEANGFDQDDGNESVDSQRHKM